MTKTKPADDALDASTFDLDAWIDDQVRPTVTILLYPFDDDYRAKVAEIEAQIPAAEQSTPENRGMDEASPEQLVAMLEELRQKRDRDALRVRVRQLLDADIVRATMAAKESGAPQDEWYLWTLAAATVAPDYDGPLEGDVPQHFTAAQLKRLRDKSRSGAGMVGQLYEATESLLKALPVPS